MDETMTYGPIVINEASTNLIPELIDKRFHVVYTDRKMFVAGQSWTEGYDLTNSWIFSTNDLDQANLVAADHYVPNTEIAEVFGIDHPVRIIDGLMCRYLDIRDEAILKVYNERRAHQMWMKSLNLLTDDENLTLYTMLDNAADKAVNEKIRHELTDIVSELLYLAYGE